MYTFYGFHTFNAVKVVLTAEELGLDYQFVHLDPSKGDLKSPEHLARHPFGKMPVLEHEGNTFIESSAICRYLANTNGQRLYSSDPVQAAKIDQILDVMTQHVGRWMSTYFWQEVVLKKYFKQDPDPQALAEAAGFLEQQLPYIDKLLGENPYLCGEAISIADTVTFAYCQLRHITSINFDPYDQLNQWYAEFAQRPSVAKVASVLKA